MFICAISCVLHPVVGCTVYCLLSPSKRFSTKASVLQLWEWHNAEQMILDYEEQNPEKFRDTKYESTVDTASAFNEENRVAYTEGYFKETLLKKKVVVHSHV
jgi:hypothetical protein